MKQKLKIAIIGSRGYPHVYSGYETLVKELSERMVKKGHHVRIYCHRTLFKNRPKNIGGIELVYTPSFETKFLSQLTNSFFSFIHACFSNLDLVLVVNSANGPFGLLTKLFGKRTYVNVDGLEWKRPKWKGIGSIYFKVASKLATILFDEIITDSYEMKRIYKDKFGVESTTIAYGSTMVQKNKSEFLTKLKLKKNEYYLIVGRLIPDNNSKILIEGFLKSKSNKKLLIVGDVPYKDKYASEIKSNGSDNIIFSGYVNSQKILTQLYNNCYCYLHGHEFGGVNPTMINALDLNCQIIAIDTIFSREMLIGKKAIYFNKNIDSIVSCIKKIESNYNNYVVLNESYKLPQKYNWDFITNQYCDLFEKK